MGFKELWSGKSAGKKRVPRALTSEASSTSQRTLRPKEKSGKSIRSTSVLPQHGHPEEKTPRTTHLAARLTKQKGQQGGGLLDINTTETNHADRSLQTP